MDRQVQVQVQRRRWRLAVLVPVVVVMVTVLAAAPAGAAAPPFCGQAWGSQAKDVNGLQPGWGPTVLTNVRAGTGPCYDRLVFDLGGPVIGYRVDYVPVVRLDGSGEAIPLRGGAFLSIILSAPAHDGDYRPTYQPADRSNIVDVRGFPTFRQAAFGGTYEGRTELGLGVRARLPFRVLVLPGPGTGSRMVLDVSHRWT